ncbi:hypothetical protein TNCV_4818891 [Trichonephila clavipes]|nr:hypothetical protein TNCV_4818891 [Trichonephila clavipes]
MKSGHGQLGQNDCSHDMDIKGAGHACSHPRVPRAHQAGLSRRSLAGVGLSESARCHGPGLALLTNGGVQQQQHNPLCEVEKPSLTLPISSPLHKPIQPTAAFRLNDVGYLGLNTNDVHEIIRQSGHCCQLKYNRAPLPIEVEALCLNPVGPDLKWSMAKDREIMDNVVSVQSCFQVPVLPGTRRADELIHVESAEVQTPHVSMVSATI